EEGLQGIVADPQRKIPLKKARASAGLSLADLAVRTGMDKAVLSKLENGLHGIPTLAGPLFRCRRSSAGRVVDPRLEWEGRSKELRSAPRTTRQTSDERRDKTLFRVGRYGYRDESHPGSRLRARTMAPTASDANPRVPRYRAARASLA